MKTPIVAAFLLLGTHLTHAEHLAPPCVQPTAAVVYDTPVVYQAPVVYTAPVVYNAPVTYQTVTPVVAAQPVAPIYPVVNMNVSPVYNPGCSSYRGVAYAAGCSSPNVIIAGQRAYRISWENSPTVIHIGGGHASHGSLPRRYR